MKKQKRSGKNKESRRWRKMTWRHISHIRSNNAAPAHFFLTVPNCPALIRWLICRFRLDALDRWPNEMMERCLGHVTGRRARALVAVAWILSALFASPILVLYQEGVIQGQVQCWIDFPQQWQWKLYITLVSVILLVLPALLIFACYIVIVRTIWVQSSALMANVSSYSRPAGKLWSAPPTRSFILHAPQLDLTYKKTTNWVGFQLVCEINCASASALPNDNRSINLDY